MPRVYFGTNRKSNPKKAPDDFGSGFSEDGLATLLFGMKVGMFQRFIREPDGSFRVAMFELTYYTDLKTGRLLETFNNPYTGETNQVPR